MKLISTIILTFYITIANAQVVYEPLHRDVYNFLSRLSQKGIIELNDNIKPLSRIYIAEKLIEVSGNDKLTPLEKEELEFFKKDFFSEINLAQNTTEEQKTMTIAEKDPAGRLRLFSYSDDLFKLNVSPVLGLKAGVRDGEKLTHLWNGIYLYGYVSDFIGFSFDFRDNTESGKTIDKFKLFTPVTGVNARTNYNIFNYSENKMEYSEVKTTLAANWKWGNFAIGKEFFEWGYGEGGKLVLSQKAPSFPFIRLDLHPVDWLSFNYIHAWLSSDVIDSNDIYYHSVGGERFHFREKYLASHTLTVTPLKGLDLSLGESIVYSDRVEVLYLMPFMFFRLADHYLSRHYNSAGANAQIFAAVSSKNHLKNTHLYSSLFIDEITITHLFDSKKHRNQLGFSFGASVVDLPINNLKFTLEYTRILPYAYAHYIQTTTYESASYVLGHWMGNNADQIYGSVQYRFLRGLQASAWVQHIRKGEAGNPLDQQTVQGGPPFLFGLRTNYTNFGLSVSYELLHELFLKGEFQISKTSQQQEDKSFIDTDLNEAYISVYYGL
jgi:hypothetical protein